MRRLLFSGLMGLFHSGIFWCMLIAMPLFNLYMAFANAVNVKIIYDAMPEILLFSHTKCFGIAIAMFMGLYVGTEFSDGTIRNKLICGHTRPGVYLSYFVSCLAGVFLTHILSVLVSYVFGTLLLGKMTVAGDVIVRDVFFSFFPLAAITAITLLIIMLCRDKVLGSVVADIVATVMALLSTATTAGMATKDAAYIRALDWLPNAYLEKIRLGEELLQAQIIPELPLPICSAITLLVLLLAGIVLFHNMDIR